MPSDLSKIPSVDPAKMTWLQMVDTWEYQGKNMTAQDMFWRVGSMNLIQSECRPTCPLDVTCAVLHQASTAYDDAAQKLVFVPTSYGSASVAIKYNPADAFDYNLLHPVTFSKTAANLWKFGYQ